MEANISSDLDRVVDTVSLLEVVSIVVPILPKETLSVSHMGKISTRTINKITKIKNAIVASANRQTNVTNDLIQMIHMSRP